MQYGLLASLTLGGGGGILRVGRAAAQVMASDETSGTRPAAPIVIRIKLRYDDIEAMVTAKANK